jgi:hypothetical protein
MNKKQVHFILQGKGGVGKSYVASILAQYLTEKYKPVKGFDTDPINKTFTEYKNLNVTRVELLDEHNRIDERQLDKLVTEMIEDQEHIFVIDNGAGSFFSLSTYIVENNLPELFAKHTIQIYVHTIIVGSDAERNTLTGFASIARGFGDPVRIVVWLNHFFGPMNDFEETLIYQENKKSVFGAINLYAKTPTTFGVDIAQMQKARLGFNEAIERPEFYVMTKQRLTMVKRDIWQQLDLIPFDM